MQVSINSMQNTQIYSRANYAKKQASFGSTVTVSQSLETLMKEKELWEAMEDLIQRAKDDGQNFILSLNLNKGLFGYLTINKGQMIKQLTPSWYTHFSDIASKVENLYNRALKIAEKHTTKEVEKIGSPLAESSPA